MKVERYLASKGFIAIKDPESYSIPPGLPYKPDSSRRVYGLSMFHQLHCLVSYPVVFESTASRTFEECANVSEIMIRERYYDLLTGRMTPDDFKFVSGLGADGELPETVNSNHGAQHIDHCFDYIQQGIRCAGQMDLEYAVRLGDTAFLAGEHHCKNWARAIMLYEKLEPDMGV
ncbi:hypothetical protein SCUP515_11658 [Seiridium cupressi]